MMLIGFSFVGAHVAAAAMISISPVGSTSEVSKDIPDTVHLKDVNQIVGTNTYRFKFETAAIQNSNIDHWEVRVSYDPGVHMTYGQMQMPFAKSGAALELPGSQAPNTFLLYMTKPTLDKRVHFSFKLKAFDKNREQLYVDRKAFIW